MEVGVASTYLIPIGGGASVKVTACAQQAPPKVSPVVFPFALHTNINNGFNFFLRLWVFFVGGKVALHFTKCTQCDFCVDSAPNVQKFLVIAAQHSPSVPEAVSRFSFASFVGSHRKSG